MGITDIRSDNLINTFCDFDRLPADYLYPFHVSYWVWINSLDHFFMSRSYAKAIKICEREYLRLYLQVHTCTSWRRDIFQVITDPTTRSIIDLIATRQIGRYPEAGR